ncbi:MmcQ/YjbR family DNA-binding protein [Leptospira semungkisensis]|nr:MmcQ/YjbR family DNA-binding protein [Leptospira semungkisensis]
MPKKVDQLARVRKICFSLPEVTEVGAWGAPTFRIRSKMFAMYREDHHGDGRLGLWLKSTFDQQEALLEFDPIRFFKPAYVGPRGWIGLHLDKNSDEEVSFHVKEAYKLIAPRKLLEKFNI